MISNSGHFNVEIDIPALEKLSKPKKLARPFVDEYAMKDGRRVYLLGEGRLDQSEFSGRPSGGGDGYELREPGAVRRIPGEARGKGLERQVYPVPEPIDRQIAKLKLESMGVQVDKLTPEQEHYLASWSEGT